MEEKFERIRQTCHRRFDELLHRLDTVYTPVKKEERALRNVEAKPAQKEETIDLKERHKMQEEALKQQEKKDK
ncbi:MAG: hypothetical protein Q4Q17_01310 [Tissierellia bacterium]|nr:hypothetical protein [Tissierellia bacterium]